MYDGRTPETLLIMTTFEDFLRELEMLVQEHVQTDLALKVEKNRENDIVQVFGEKAVPLARAKNGLEDVLELAHTTAEHHPFWSLLDNSAEIAATVLEKWCEEMSDSELDEIKWHIKALDRHLERMGKKTNSL